LNERGVSGIRLRVHLLFWAVIGLSVAAGYFVEILTLFVIVLIHEMGHVAVARELGWQVAEIQFLPFGGVAHMEEEAAAEPLDEIVVALAGPFMNVVMAFFSLVFWRIGLWSAEWTHFFVTSNFLIAGFNLLPIWPLDGGRILQALLGLSLPYRMAALCSLGASISLSAVLLGVGVFHLHVNAMAVGGYLLAINVQAFLRFPYQFIRFLMIKYSRAPEGHGLYPVRLAPRTTVWEAASHLRKGRYHLIYITGGEGGLLAEERLLHALLFEQKKHLPISTLL
jgi:stage IV sporulation protein FB